MVIDSIFNVGDTVWAMIDNKPTECEVAGIAFDSGVIGCDGNTRSVFGESFYQDTTCKYYIVKKSKFDKEGKWQRWDVEKYPKVKKFIFASKEECVMSLFKEE